LEEIRLGSNSEKHFSDPEIILAASPEMWVNLDLKTDVSPKNELKVEAFGKLHRFWGDKSVSTVTWSKWKFAKA